MTEPAQDKRSTPAFRPALLIRGASFAVVALLGLVAGTHSLLLASHETASTTATVVEFGSCRTRESATATFTVDGRLYHADVECTHDVGERVEIRYDPADPTRNGDTAGGIALRYGFGALGLAMLALVVWKPRWW